MPLTGPFNRPGEALIELLSSLAAFQAWLGVDGEPDPEAAAQAEGFLHGFSAADIAGKTKWYMMEPPIGTGRWTMQRITTAEMKGDTGSLRGRFYEIVPDGEKSAAGADDSGDITRTGWERWLGEMGDIIEGLRAAAGTRGLLLSRVSVENLGPSGALTETAEGLSYIMEVDFEWQFTSG